MLLYRGSFMQLPDVELFSSNRAVLISKGSSFLTLVIELVLHIGILRLLRAFYSRQLRIKLTFVEGVYQHD